MSSTNQKTMSSAKSVAPKKVKAVVATVPVVAAPVVPVLAAVAVAVPVKKAKKVDAVVVPSVPSVLSGPVVTAQAVAAETVVAEETSWQEELRTVQEQLSAIRDAAVAAIAASKRLEKRVGREMKDARKNRRRKQAPLAEGEERKPSIFQIPVPITDELSVFLGGGKGNQMSRSSVTKAISVYVKENGLNDKHKINPNPALRKLLGVKEGDELTIFNMQSYLQKHYVKAVPVVPTA